MFSAKKFDFYLLLPIVFLLGLSIVTIVSVAPENLISHLFYIAIALVFFIIFSFLDISMILPFAPFFYVFSILFLIAPFIFGTVTRGSVRWIPIGNFTIQPSEIVKPFIAIFSAWFWANKDFSLKRFFVFGGLLFPSLFLVFLQPDLGSTLVIFSMLIGIILYSGINKKQLLVTFICFLAILPVFWFSLKDYQKLRVVHFINPYSDPLGEGYNIIQAKIAVGSGNFFGKGFGRGTQSHLSFLPERHTDFVFASLAEELGFTGSFMVILLYLLLLFRILRIAKQQAEKSTFLITVSLFFYLSFQIFVNIGMNIGLLPITGITLPLISYGGSSLLATMITLGMVESISRKSKREEVIEIR